MELDQEKFRKVEEVFHQVSELPGEARAAALEQACHGDIALRREVESLLAHADPAGSPLPLTRTLQGCLAEPACDPNVGRRIGPYELRSSLGSGGMANVYLALQTEPIQRIVAVKLIKRGLDTDEAIRRFQNERQVLADLKHPSITQLLDAGSTDDHLPYFVMEHVTGEPITRYCERHRLTTRQRLQLFQKVCSAVHFAHQNAVIHRDLKPAHILVTPEGNPKLLDFGISKLLHPGPAGPPQATRSDERFMTFEYASPEQIEGNPITTASDVYSLGVVLYELLTDVRPRELADGPAQPPHQDDPDPPKPSETVGRLARPLPRKDEPDDRAADARRPAMAPAQLRKELRGDLDNIVMTALRREPHLRYPSAEHFAADIERHLRHEPVLAAPPGLAYRIAKFARRNRALVALMVALLVGAAGSTAGAIQALRARNAARIAESSAHHHAEQLRRALGIRDITLASLHQKANLVGNMKSRLAAVPPDLRGWEWGYLNALADNSLQTWRGHDGEVRALAASPDGTAVASGGMDKTVRIWDPGSGRTMRVLSGHQGRITSLAYTPDARRLVSAGMDGAARIWDARTGQLVRVVREAGPGIVSAKFSPDGQWLSLASVDRAVTIYDASTLAEARRLEGFGGTFNAVAFTADGQCIAVASDMPVIRLWDVRTGAMVREFEGLTGRICSIAFSSDGRWMATAICDRKPTLTQLSTGRSRSLSGRIPMVGMVAFSPDGGRLVCSGIGHTALRTWQETRDIGEYRGHEKLVLPVIFSPDGRRIISGSDDGTIKLWEADPVPAVGVLSEHRGQIAKAEFIADGSVLVSVGATDGFLYLWDVESRRMIRRFSPHPSGVRSLAVSPDGSLLATCGADGYLRVYESAAASLVWRARVGREPVLCLAFSADNARIITGSQDGTMTLWDAASGKPIRNWSRAGASVNAVQFAHGARKVVAAASDGQVTLWDADTGYPIRNLPAHKGAALSLSVAPDGSTFASGGHDGTIRVWGGPDARPVQTISAHEGDVLSLAFSPDGQRLVSGGGDFMAKLWDTDTWSETLGVRRSDAAVSTAVFSHNGRLLSVGDGDGRLFVLDSASNAVQFPSRQDLVACEAQAAAAIDEAALRSNDWPSLAAVIRADPALPDAVKGRVFVQILSRAAEGLPLTADWRMTYLSLPPTPDVPSPEAWSAAPRVAGPSARSIRFDWGTRAPAPGVPEDRFGLVAEADVRLPAGTYRLTAWSDDGVRVWVDDVQVIDDWTSHPLHQVTTDSILSGGVHRVRIEYFDNQGDAFLSLGFTRTDLHPLSSPETSPSDE